MFIRNAEFNGGQPYFRRGILFTSAKFLTVIFLMFCALPQSMMAQTSGSTAAQNPATQTSAAQALLQSAQSQNLTDAVLRLQLALSAPDYRVTAGDVYTLAYSPGVSSSGTVTTVQIPITIDTSYRVRVSNMGIANSDGKTYQQLKRQVEAIVLENYPLSPVEFTMIRPASFVVYVKGEVRTAQSMEAWALTRLSDALTRTVATSSIGGGGGILTEGMILTGMSQQNFQTSSILTDFASTRDITILSSNGTKRTYDLFKATRDGDLSQNPYLRPGDIITVGRVQRRVTIGGAVERPGTYQLLEGENLNELIVKYGGGLTRFADKANSEILRYTPDNTIIKLTEKDFDDTFELLDYDNVTIRPTTNMYVAITENPLITNYVTVSGSVRMPGRYPHAADRNWEYYIGLAGGFIKTENSFSSVTITDLDGKRLTKKSVIRPETVITANTNNFLYYFNQYAPPITAVLSVITAFLSIQTYLNK
jgi:protein involved in polysaccharide export with SLBB domain